MQTTNQVRFDSDLVRWGLHLLDGGGSLFPPSSGNNTASQTSNPSYESSTTSNYYNYANEGATGRESEDPGYGTAGVYQDSGLSNHFQSLGVEEEDTMAPRRAGTPDYEEYQHGSDDEFNLAIALSKSELAYDREVRRRLVGTFTLDHSPKVNTAFPTIDQEKVGHRELKNRLRQFGLKERQIMGDGNCQFRAVSDQLFRSQDYHKYVRKCVIDQLNAKPDLYRNFVPGDYNEYVKKMAKLAEWGDHVTIQAAADCFGVTIFIMTSYMDGSGCHKILPRPQDGVHISERALFLIYWSEVHYNSLDLEGAEPRHYLTSVRKKKHWLLKSIF
ncbi:hypothetical protein MPTK1_2g22320 [Marchantia polymorpha subsp. ruderalis]|uniref:OTU domain-containing protein n=2 Tax=Marchantia polymorpha TaxID=3197 RepID=A0A2R6WNC6_MARPO|nr:hypothetical protein MARPO_0072s0095 [Marchantia polymorpha]BBN03288.1 hypothetical protein Mp_2g22320 [Marchantia polymorpha subsp. ruderalis]|eukprot:PTQ35359.1 hypothetical protein MARPO_0072s0095 [Marchantia polymorpha]